MLRTRRLFPVLTYAVASLSLLALAGCGPARQTIKGTVIYPAGATPKEADSVTVSFVPEQKGELSGLAVFSGSDKTSFTVNANDGKSGLPLGKYKVRVGISAYSGPDQSQRQSAFDSTFNAKYNNDNSPLQYESTGGAQSITIDTVKGTVTKS